MDKPREIELKEVEFSIEVEPEEMQIEGNASAIDEEMDAEIVKNIREQLNAGNEWDWCWIKITEKYKSFSGFDSLGGCSYKDKEEFLQCPYYEDMKSEALRSLNDNIKEQYENLQAL